MAENSLLDGQKILIVDDEDDVLSTLEDLLSMCTVVKCSSFWEAMTRGFGRISLERMASRLN